MRRLEATTIHRIAASNESDRIGRKRAAVPANDSSTGSIFHNSPTAHSRFGELGAHPAPPPCCTVLQLVCRWAYFRGHSFTDESLCRFLCAVAYEQTVRGSRPSVELMGNCGSCPQSMPARHVRAASHPVVGSNRHVDTALQDVISPTVAWELVREDQTASVSCATKSHRTGTYI
jgi:hypothetical protein